MDLITATGNQFSMPDLATLKARRDEVDEAIHQLELGHKEVSVTHGNGRRVQFQEVNLASLRAYLARLDDQIARLEGRRGRGPIYPVI